MATYLDEYITNKQSKAPADDGVSLERMRSKIIYLVGYQLFSNLDID
tara:strand:+ start:277 stop:417 length:141 start_codon:yes stop_codon:yes gene_type:complete